MLTVKSPISLVINRPIGQGYDSFGQRILGNYQLLQTNLEAEDFLHLVTAPPEIYFGEGGMTQLVENVDIRQDQNVKLSLINNMVNRIVLAQSDTITYQDRVFISGIMRKLGIRQIQKFMKEINSLREETNNIRELVHIYSEHSDTLREMTLQYKQEMQAEGEPEAEETGQQQRSDNYLYQTILNRLQIDKIYQEMKTFTMTYPGNNTYIRQDEMRLSEQNRLLQQIQLQKLQNVTHMEQQPLVYQHINAYEYEPEESTTIKASVTTRLVQAVLYDILDRIYNLRMPQLEISKHSWYRLNQDFYQAAGDTIERFQENHRMQVLHADEVNTYMEQMQYQQNQELQSLKQLITYAEQVEQVRNTEQYINAGDLTWNSEQRTNERTETYNTQTQIEQELKNISENLNNEQMVVQNSQTRIEQELKRINRQNIENRQKAVQILEQTREVTSRMPDRKEMMRQGLRALEHPQEVLLEYHQRIQQETTEQTQLTEAYDQILTPETREIFRILEQYRKNPEQVVKQGLVREQADGQLMADLVYQEQQLTEEQQKTSEVFLTEAEEHVYHQTVEQWNRPQEYRELHQELPQIWETIDLVHKEQTNHLDEEVIEELLEQNHTLRQNTVQKEQLLTTEHIEELQTRTVHHQTVETSAADIEKMIQQGMRNQVAELSDQVYNRLERRLGNDRMRRGR